VQLEPVLATLRAAIQYQASLTGDDPQVDSAVGAVIAALEPALRQAATDLAQQAAAEVDAQLPEHTVSVVLRGADLELRVDAVTPAPPAAPAEDLDARITLRLPPSLKEAVERVANIDGGSVNSWVVDTLSRSTARPARGGERITEEFDL
jgi:uncharacterized protein (DUF1778 family)